MNDLPNPGLDRKRTKPDRPGGKTPRRKRSPAIRDAAVPQSSPSENVLEPAAGGPVPKSNTERPGLFRKQFSQLEWDYLEGLSPGSLAEEIKLMRVLSLRLAQQGIQAATPADEIRYYREATRIMARLPQLLKAEKVLNSGKDEITLAMIRAINTVLEDVDDNPPHQLELPFGVEDGDT